MEPHEQTPPSPERRDRPRAEGSPLRWREIAQRKDWEQLPFAHYFTSADALDKQPAE